MKYTVAINEKKKEIRVVLDGYEGVAKCCPTDRFDLQTGIELALERAKVAKANANKPTAKPTVAEARAVLEEYVGDHIAVIGKGRTLSENQQRELRRWADRLAPSHSCECEDKYKEGYDKGYTDGYDEGYADGCGECECECECECCDEVDEITTLVGRIMEILRK